MNSIIYTLFPQDTNYQPLIDSLKDNKFVDNIGKLHKNNNGVYNIPLTEEDCLKSYQYFNNQPIDIYIIGIDNEIKIGDYVAINILNGFVISKCINVKDDEIYTEHKFLPYMVSEVYKIIGCTNDFFNIPILKKHIIKQWVNDREETEQYIISNMNYNIFNIKPSEGSLTFTKKEIQIILDNNMFKQHYFNKRDFYVVDEYGYIIPDSDNIKNNLLTLENTFNNIYNIINIK